MYVLYRAAIFFHVIPTYTVILHSMIFRLTVCTVHTYSTHTYICTDILYTICCMCTCIHASITKTHSYTQKEFSNCVLGTYTYMHRVVLTFSVPGLIFLSKRMNRKEVAPSSPMAVRTEYIIAFVSQPTSTSVMNVTNHTMLQGYNVVKRVGSHQQVCHILLQVNQGPKHMNVWYEPQQLTNTYRLCWIVCIM